MIPTDYFIYQSMVLKIPIDIHYFNHVVDDQEGSGRLSDLPTNLFKSLALSFS